MAYLTVEVETMDRLRLSRAPSIYSWALFGGFITLGFTAAYYGEDYMLWKIIYVMAGIFIGTSCMDDWEECDFNKASGQIRLKRCSAWDILLTPITVNEDVVIAKIEEVSEVKVQEENLNYFGKVHQVVLQFETGMSLQITKAFTFGPSNNHEAIAQRIRSFLALESAAGGDVSSQDDAYMGDTSSTEEEEEDDFERIEAAEVVDGINPDK